MFEMRVGSALLSFACGGLTRLDTPDIVFFDERGVLVLCF